MPGENIDKRLKHAAERIMTPIPPEGESAKAAMKNLATGLARFHWVQERYGYSPDASFTASAVLALPKNKAALEAGFAYGGMLKWTGEIVPTKIKSTGCGYLAAGLADAPAPSTINKKIREAASMLMLMDGINLVWDLDRGNHFLNIYHVSNPERIGGWPYLAVLHSSGAEMRYDGVAGPGVYVHHSEYWKPLVKKIDTPWGRLAVLVGKAATQYAERCREVLGFCAKRRFVLIKSVLPKAEVLFNAAHHGFTRPGEFLLGCHSGLETAAGSAWYPFMTGKDKPAYLLEPLPGCKGVLPHGAGAEPDRDIPGLLDRTEAVRIAARLEPVG